MSGCTYAPKPEDPFRKISPAELVYDFNDLVKKIHTNSFEPYLIHTKPKTDSIAATIESKLTDSMTVVQFYRLIRPYVSAFNDAHLSLYLPDLYYKQFKQKGGKLFPFAVAIDGGRLFIRDNLSRDTRVKPGMEITSINGIATKKLLGDMFSFISGDTYPYKVGAAEERFQILLWRMYGFNNGFDVAFTNGQHIVAKGIPDTKPDTITTNDAFNFRIVKNVGIMNISEFLYEKKKIFDQYLQNTFAQIKRQHINALIIDIRGNGGGSTQLVRDVYNYIGTTPYTFGNSETYMENGKIKTDNTIKPDTLATVTNKFGGKVFLLIDPQTYSTAFMMANTFQYYKMGVIVGDSSAEQMQMSGEVSQSELPNSGILLYCPTTAFVIPNHNNKEKRLYPDHYIVPSLQDKLSEKDTVLNYCIKLAGGK